MARTKASRGRDVAAPTIDRTQALLLYREMLRARMIEERMLLLLRQGKVSKWFSGIGQEAIAVGATLALSPDDYVLPLHRNLGVFTSRGVPLRRLIAQWQGTRGGFTKGRDRSFHFGTNDYRIVGMISHLGPQLAVAGGIALAERLRGTGRIAMAFTGEGGTSEGDFHEALNVASVWDLPVIFLIENNGYALSTPTTEQYRARQLSDRAAGYGMQGLRIDGNDVHEVFRTVSDLAADMRERPRPILVECMTFRMRGHEEASGIKYVPAELLTRWAERDPVLRAHENLRAAGHLDDDTESGIRATIKQEIDEAVEEAFAEPPPSAHPDAELGDVYASAPSSVRKPRPAAASRETRFIDAITEAHTLALERFPDLIVMGQDIAEYGGVFKITEGLLTRFGRDRIRNTPLCESAIIGAALGLSIRGYKSIVEMQFADFVTCGFNQIVNNLAKSHYRWGQNADVVVRMPTGAGTGAGPFHSQSNEAWFAHVPGLKIVYPAFPADAKGLLLSAIEDPNPVMYFEHKLLYRSISGPVPEGYHVVPIGEAATVREGSDATILTYGAGTHWCLDLLNHRPELSVLLVDLRSIVPLDLALIESAVRHTGRVLIFHEDTLFGGVGGEIAAWIAENCFEHLDAPILRCAALDTPVPFAKPLEESFLPRGRLEEALDRLLSY